MNRSLNHRPRFHFFVVPFFLCLGFFGICHAVETFTVRIHSDLGHFDWNQGEIQPLIMDQLMEGLTRFDERGELVPALALNWKASPDQMTWTFKLRPQLKWSDGSKLCAEDFVRSWQRLLSKEIASPFAFYIYFIKNAQAIVQGQLKPHSLGAVAPDCQTLQVTLARPVSFFPEVVSHWVTFPMPATKPMASFENALTAGPFTFSTWKKGEEILLRKNPYYYGASKVSLERLRFTVISEDQTALRLFREGRLHWLGDLPFGSRQSLIRNHEAVAYPTRVYYYLLFGFNNKDEIIPKELRCNIIKALNTKQIPIFLQGKEISLSGLLTSNADKNKDHSDSLSQQSSETLSKLVLHYYAKDIHEPLVEWIQSQMKQNLGIEMKLKKWEPKTYWDMLSKTPPGLFLSGSTAWFRHPYSLALEMRDGSGANFGKFKSSEYERIAEKIIASKHPSESLLRQADELLVREECALAPLYQRTTLVMVSPSWVVPAMNDLARIAFKDVRPKTQDLH